MLERIVGNPKQSPLRKNSDESGQIGTTEFEAFVRRNYKILYWRLTHYFWELPQPVIQDLVQDGLTQAWRSIDQCQSRDVLLQWVWTITKHVGGKYLESEGKRKGAEAGFAQKYGTHSFTPEEEFMRREKAQDIHRAIGRLPKSYRDTLDILCEKRWMYGEGSQLAQETAITTGNFYVKVCRTRKALGMRLREEGIAVQSEKKVKGSKERAVKWTKKDLERLCETKTGRKRLESAVATLPDKERRFAAVYYLEGASYTEAARQLHISNYNATLLGYRVRNCLARLLYDS